jgi:ubiquinone/menaquinone biosynthesis C-methylase UbiE
MSSPDPARAAEQKEAVREQWTNRAAAFAAMAARDGGMLRPATDLMVAALRRHPGMRVLDVASGAGEPALSLAAAIAPDGGHVTATDLVPEMLRAAEENARTRDVTNITFQQADAESLLFPDASFDAVTCRFGVMLFPDMQKGLGEMRRVLRPDGQLLCMVWGPPERDAMSRALMVVRRHVALPPPSPAEGPGRFRLAAPGALAAQLRAAGFRQVTDAEHAIPVRWPGTIDDWWETMLRMNGAMRDALDVLDEERRAAIVREVFAAKRAAEQQEGGETSAVILATAIK